MLSHYGVNNLEALLPVERSVLFEVRPVDLRDKALEDLHQVLADHPVVGVHGEDPQEDVRSGDIREERLHLYRVYGNVDEVLVDDACAGADVLAV